MAVRTEIGDLGLDGPDPYAGYRWLRANRPVAWSTAANGWLVSTYDDVVAVLKDFDRFRQAPFFAGPQRFVFDLDEPEHKVARRVYTAGGSFSGRSIGDRIGAEVVSIAQATVAALPDDGFDGVRDLARPAVVEMIGRLFELPRPQDSRLDWSASLTGNYPDPASERGRAELAFVQDLIAARRRSPGSDPFTHIIRANEVANAVSEEDLAWELWDMIFAGGHSTVDQAGLALRALSAAAESPARARFADAGSASQSVEELLRFAPHVHRLGRVAARDTALGEVTIRRGEAVFVLLASANHDEAKWPHPTLLDLSREGGPPVLTFGTGVHATPGATFVRMALAALLGELFRRFDRIEPAGDYRCEHLTEGGLISLVCPNELPLVGR